LQTVFGSEAPFDKLEVEPTGRCLKLFRGFVETELFATVYKAFGMEPIKSPLIEVEGTMEPFENGKGFTLRVLKVRQP
jgi:hypothetical protein